MTTEEGVERAIGRRTRVELGLLLALGGSALAVLGFMRHEFEGFKDEALEGQREALEAQSQVREKMTELSYAVKENTQAIQRIGERVEDGLSRDRFEAFLDLLEARNPELVVPRTRR